MTAVTLFILYSVIPSVHVKLKSGQFPPWGSMEPYIQGRWHKFITNDGQVVDIGKHTSEEVVEFSKKCQAFSYWTYKRFQGKAVVCLPLIRKKGKEKNLSSQQDLNSRPLV